MLASSARSQSGGPYRMVRTSLDGGSTPHASGGAYELLDGTVGTPGSGGLSGGAYALWIGPLAPGPSGTTAIEPPAAIPTRFALFAPQPNPFHGLTEIVFDLPADARARVAIYALSGARVRTLLDERRAAGRHRVRWDGADDTGRQTPAGIYFARVDGGAATAVTRIARVE